jgi:signal transduction histidine kinase
VVRPTTLLVVDDSRERRALIRDLFEPPDYRVLEAVDGTAGLDLIHREQPDCVLLGLDLPDLDSFEVLERLRGDSRTREVAVVVLTAGDDGPGRTARALRAGAVDYITMPASPARVAARVRAAIERHRLLQELHETRRRYTSMLAHDLKSPLTVITGYLQLLELSSAALLPQQRRHLTAIRGACTRMAGLIADLLEVSTLEAGPLTLERGAVDLTSLAAASVEHLRPAAAQQSVLLDFRSAGPAIVDADAGRLEQVLANLLGHALKFTPGGGRIDVEVWTDGEAAHVAVSNSGPGIPAADAPRPVEPSGASAVEPVAGTGSGLGLVICRHLVEAHGGRIWVESASDRGARVVFRLGLAGEAPGTGPPRPPPTPRLSAQGRPAARG